MQQVSRHQQRVWALQILYSLDLMDELEHSIARKYIKEYKEKEGLEDSIDYYFQLLVTGVIDSYKDYDHLINKCAIDWNIDRMAYVDRNILRIALFELDTDIPVGVVIDEAVELAKEFGDEKSPSFINGILAKRVSN